ncbi:MAG: VanZ family protein [Saccharothrix sp.]|nr:VanZ family protein [Saccharothrix sp.]
MAFFQLVLEPRVLLLLVAGFFAATMIGLAAGRRMKTPPVQLAFALGSLWLIVAAMFFIGRGGIRYKGLYPDIATSRILGNPLRGLAGWNGEAILNVVLYMPFAISLVLLTRKVWLVLVAGTAVAVLFEFVQVLMGWGACGGPDFVRNTAGVVIGALSTWAVIRTLKRQSPPGGERTVGSVSERQRC